MVVVANSQRMNQHTRRQSFAGFQDESRGLARNGNRNLLTISVDESKNSAISAKLGKVSVGAPPEKSAGGPMGTEDLLTSDGGKHDYDWLLTPPGTPLGDKQVCCLLAPMPAPPTRPTSVPKASRMSVGHSDVSASAKPTRSTSTARPSTASSYLLGSPRSALSTSSTSVHSRRSTPTRRTPATSPSRPATPPPRTKPTPTSPRPSTPTSRAQIMPKPSSPVKPIAPAVIRTPSRPSTPTRRAPSETPVRSPSPTTRSPATTTMRSPATATRSGLTTSHARSPSPKPQSRKSPSTQDLPTEVPPNLRTTTAPPERPSSAARSRPSSAHGTRSSETATKDAPMVRRPSPSRGRDPSIRDHVVANGHSENNHVGTRTPASRPLSSTTDNGGFGRTISKKSIDMALRHMDIRQSSGNIRALAGNSLFPQSVRPTTFKIRPSNQSDSQEVSEKMSNGKISGNGHAEKVSDHENGKERSQFVDLITERLAEKLKEAGKIRETDISISRRYDSFLLKEDLKNTEWLHSLNDQSPIFDQRFEQLPEPFSFT